MWVASLTQGREWRRVSVRPEPTFFSSRTEHLLSCHFLLVFLASFEYNSRITALQEASNCSQVFERCHIPDLSVMNFEEHINLWSFSSCEMFCCKTSFIFKFEPKVKYYSNKIGDCRFALHIARVGCEKYNFFYQRTRKKGELWRSRRRWYGKIEMPLKWTVYEQVEWTQLAESRVERWVFFFWTKY